MLSRKKFLAGMGATAGGMLVSPSAQAQTLRSQTTNKRPRAITMWDFSWLERRWPGAGYEDWDKALDELTLRGYDAVRIDVYPHLIDADPMKTWRLKPTWHVQDWGAPGLVDVQVLPALIEFMGKCHQRGVKLGISTWFREDMDNIRMGVTDGNVLARIWKNTLDHITEAGLLDSVLYVDVCNEWPGPIWAPFVQPELQWGEFYAPSAEQFMRPALDSLRTDYPHIPFLFSTNNGDIQDYVRHDVSYLDAIDHHEWMVNENGNEFYNIIGYEYQRFSQEDYIKMQQLAASTYSQRPEYWNALLKNEIIELAAVSRKISQPMIITECWAIVDYKDWPLLPWNWVKDVCAIGTLCAANTGRWLVNATSNFCGPQFVGMWRDVEWHQRLTGIIKNASVETDLQSGKLWARL